MTKIARRAFLGSSLSLLTLRVLPVHAQTTWNAYTYTPAATLAPARGLTRIAEGMEKASAGALKIRIHLAGSLPISATDISNALSDNIVQLGDDGLFQGNLPITGILRLPMLVNSSEEFDTAVEIMRPYFEKAYTDKGVILLGQYYYPLQVAWSRKPLNSLQDISSQKMRVTSPEQGEFVRRLGGIPVTLGAAEVPSALDRGVVDGVFTASSGGGKIWRDLLKYSYRLGPNFFDASIAVSRAAFEKLKPDVQAQLRTIVSETVPWITSELRREEVDVTKQLSSGGITVVEPKDDEVQKAAKLMAPYWEEWAKSRGGDANAALTKVRVALGR